MGRNRKNVDSSQEMELLVFDVPLSLHRHLVFVSGPRL